MRTFVDGTVKPVSSTGNALRAITLRWRPLWEFEPRRSASRPVYVTDHGLEQLLRQLCTLVASKRPELVSGIRGGGGSGTGKGQRLEQIIHELTIVDGLIRRLRELIRDAVVIDFTPSPDGTVSVGAWVRLITGSGQETFRIVGWLEADSRMGLISNESLLGQALVGRAVGDLIEWRTADLLNMATVLSVNWSGDDGSGGPADGGPSDSVNQGLRTLDRPNGPRTTRRKRLA